MGSPDATLETSTGIISLDIKTVNIVGGSRPLRSIREWNPRFPRKLKKRLKEYHGENYQNWLNSPIKWIPPSITNIYSYHNVDAEKELTQFLKDNEDHEINKTN